MKKSLPFPLAWVLSLCVIGSVSLHAEAQSLPTTHLPQGVAYAIAQDGAAYGAGTELYQGFAKWENGKMVPLNLPFGAERGYYDVFANNSGVVVEGPGTNHTDTRLYAAGNVVVVGQGAPRGLSENGIFGFYPAGSSQPQILQWNGSAIVTLATLPSSYQIVSVTPDGTAYGVTDYRAPNRIFKYKDGALTFLTEAGSFDLFGASASGSLVGLTPHVPASGGDSQVFVLKDLAFTLLGPSVGTSQEGSVTTKTNIIDLRMNDAGQVVGLMHTYSSSPATSSESYNYIYWNASDPQNRIILSRLMPNAFLTGSGADYLKYIYGLTESGLLLLDNGATGSSPTYIVDVSSLRSSASVPTPTPTPTATLTNVAGGDSTSGTGATPTPTPTNVAVLTLKKPKVTQRGKNAKVACPAFAGGKATVVVKAARSGSTKASRSRRVATSRLKPGRYSITCEYTADGVTVAVSKPVQLTIRKRR